MFTIPPLVLKRDVGPTIIIFFGTQVLNVKSSMGMVPNAHIKSRGSSREVVVAILSIDLLIQSSLIVFTLFL